MPRPTIRPAQGTDFHPLQAMSCSGDGPSCYPSFVSASHKFFVAKHGSRLVGFVCAYPTISHQTRCIRLLKPYLYSSHLGQGIEDELKAAALQWAEEKLDCHFFREDALTIHPIKPHQYLESLKYDAREMIQPTEPQTVATPVSQPVYAPSPLRAYG